MADKKKVEEVGKFALWEEALPEHQNMVLVGCF